MTDSFARSSAARAWKEVKDLTIQLEAVLARMERIEKAAPIRKLQRCGWCGEWSLAPVCAQHIDLMTPAEILEEALSA